VDTWDVRLVLRLPAVNSRESMAESKSRSHEAGGTPPDGVEAFIARWAGAGGSESANYGLFVQELCRLLGVPEPDPASEDTRDNAYVFQRRVTFRHIELLQAPCRQVTRENPFHGSPFIFPPCFPLRHSRQRSYGGRQAASGRYAQHQKAKGTAMCDPLYLNPV
jgi:hypothetical protein